MSDDAVTLRRTADELVRHAMATEDLNERGRMISLAAHWHMRAVEIERGPAVGSFDVELDLEELATSPVIEAELDRDGSA